jgi:hypothetical protein
MVELAEDFREDFDGQIEQVDSELGGHHLFFGNSNARYELSFGCSRCQWTRPRHIVCASGQSGYDNNQPVMHAAETQEHVDPITMVAIVLLKTKEIEISAFCNSQHVLAPLLRMLQCPEQELKYCKYMLRGGVTTFELPVVYCISS